MKKSTRRILIGVGALVAALIALRIVAGAAWPTINDVRTGATPEYPDLQPQRFARPMAEVFAAALATLREMEMEIVGTFPEKNQIQAVATTRVLHFRDDVTVALHREGDATVVNLRSHSRVGKGDLGTNARRIRDFQARLTRKLQP